jgi:hypothetical protein
MTCPHTRYTGGESPSEDCRLTAAGGAQFGEQTRGRQRAPADPSHFRDARRSRRTGIVVSIRRRDPLAGPERCTWVPAGPGSRQCL